MLLHAGTSARPRLRMLPPTMTRASPGTLDQAGAQVHVVPRFQRAFVSDASRVRTLPMALVRSQASPVAAPLAAWSIDRRPSPPVDRDDSFDVEMQASDDTDASSDDVEAQAPHGQGSSSASGQTPAQRRIDNAREGSHARHALSKDRVAVGRLLRWLRDEHLQWLVAMSNASRIVDPTALQEELEVSLCLHGSKMIDKARCGVRAYDVFSKKYGSRFEGGSAYPPSSLIVAMFVRTSLEDSQDRKARRALESVDGSVAPPRPYKGTMGNSRLKELSYAHAIFGAPFPKTLLKETVLQLMKIKPAGIDRAIEETAAWSVAFQIKLEQLANKSELAEQPLNAIRAFAISGITGLRTVELLMSRFTLLVSILLTDIDQSSGRMAILLCDGGKPSTVAERKPFEVLVRGAGLTGPWPWFVTYVHGLIGKPYIFRDFKRPITRQGSLTPGEWRSGGTMEAREWRGDQCAPDSLVTRAFVDIAETSPYPVPLPARVAAHLTAYGARHLLPSIARAATGTSREIPLGLVNELGRWDPRVILGVAEASRAAAAAGSAAARKAAAEAMALRYAPNLFKGLRARDLVSEIVRHFIDAYGILAIDSSTARRGTDVRISFSTRRARR